MALLGVFRQFGECPVGRRPTRCGIVSNGIAWAMPRLFQLRSICHAEYRMGMLASALEMDREPLGASPRERCMAHAAGPIAGGSDDHRPVGVRSHVRTAARRRRVSHAVAGPPQPENSGRVQILLSAALQNGWRIVSASPEEQALLEAHGFGSGRVQ